MNASDVTEFAESDSKICEKCQLSLFQVLDILETYVNSDAPPKWIVQVVKEFSWIYQKNPRTMGYFNTVLEVVEEFIFESHARLPSEEIIELNVSALPNNKILKLLSDAMVIEVKGDFVYPGLLVKKLQQIRWEGYDLTSTQLESRFLELHGIVTIAITRAMILNQEQIPRQVLALFSVLSNQIIVSGDEEIESIVPQYSFDNNLNIFLQGRQVTKMKRHLSGLADGNSKFIKDIDDNGSVYLKDSTVVYLTEMRERWRDRERERARS